MSTDARPNIGPAAIFRDTRKLTRKLAEHQDEYHDLQCAGAILIWGWINS